MGRLEDLGDVYNPLANAVVDSPVEMSPGGSIQDEVIAALPDESAPAGVKVIRFLKLPLRSWKDSPEVTALSSFLKEPAAHGIQMIVEKDSFRLKFKPGLRPDRDPERWQSAEKAYTLLLDALDDLIDLKDLGLLTPDGH